MDISDLKSGLVQSLATTEGIHGITTFGSFATGTRFPCGRYWYKGCSVFHKADIRFHPPDEYTAIVTDCSLLRFDDQAMGPLVTRARPCDRWKKIKTQLNSGKRVLY